ncbi:MAG: hypothetical protein KKF77_14975 [Proteobacteria bacterium]|nr:hypothetical protein [Pseudomonadota bacterium]
MKTPDVRIVWLNVHGGVFHKLLTLHERLTARGLSCELLFSVGPPRGLKIGVDVPEALLPELTDRGIHFLSRPEVLRRAEETPARLTITDAHQDADLPGLISGLRGRGARTAQMATLLGDFTYHGAAHVLMQHPLTLFFEMEYNRTPESRALVQAQSVQFTGNIFFEPTVNRLVNDYPDREAFCSRYGFDPARPLYLWLPNSIDARSDSYGQVVRAVAEAGANLVVKLHPWEYAFKKHGGEGVDPWGLGRTTDELWSVRAVDETDGAWAFRFCDMALVRASATIQELPFWEKPCALLPSATYAKLINAQTQMVRTCSVPLSGVDELASLLSGPLPHFRQEDYATARHRLRQDISRDAYEQTVEAVLRILASPADAPVLGSLRDIKRLYDPYVDWTLACSLRPLRLARFLLSRALRSMAG